MNKLYIQPRQSGKTTSILNDFFKNPEKSLIVVMNQVTKQYLTKRLFSDYYSLYITKNILTVQEFCNYSHWRGIKKLKYNNIFIDDYLMFNNSEKKLLYSYYNNFNSVNKDIHWEIRTSANMLFDENLLVLTTALKKCKDTSYIYNNFSNELKNNIDKNYWFNFITSPEWEIVPFKEIQKQQLSQEQYKTDILGEFLK